MFDMQIRRSYFIYATGSIIVYILFRSFGFEYSIFFFVIISNGIMFVVEYANFGGCMHSRSLRIERND